MVSGLKFCVCSLSPAGAVGIKFFLHLWCSVIFPRRLFQTPRVWVRPTERLTTHFRFPFVSFLFFSYAGRLAFRFLLALLFVCFCFVFYLFVYFFFSSGRFLWGIIFFRLQTDLFLLSSWLMPRKERKSSRLFSEWVWLLAERLSRSVFRFSRVAVARISD